MSSVWFASLQHEFHVTYTKHELRGDVPDNQFIMMDAQNEREMILLKDWEMRHIEDMFYVDHRQVMRVACTWALLHVGV